MSADDDYIPIDCSLHDRLEDLATRRRVVRLRYESEVGVVEIDDVIADWLVRDGAEFLRLRSGADIRLDRILEIDGHPHLPATSNPGGGEGGGEGTQVRAARSTDAHLPRRDEG